MRHQKRGRKLSRTASHRKALLSNLALALFKSDLKRIRTTVSKAKEARKLVDSLITKAKRASVEGTDNAKVVHAKREIYKYIRDREVITGIFTEIVPKVKERPGGYTRVVKIGQRLGDAAEMAILELVDFNVAQDKEAATTKEKAEETSTTSKTASSTEEKKSTAKKTVKKPAGKKEKAAAPKKEKKETAVKVKAEKPKSKPAAKTAKVTKTKKKED
jgi:large subunit ribosomal protein L17